MCCCVDWAFGQGQKKRNWGKEGECDLSDIQKFRQMGMGPERPDFAPCCKWGTEVFFHYTFSCIIIFKWQRESVALLRNGRLLTRCLVPDLQRIPAWLSVCTSWGADQLHVAVTWAALGYFMKGGGSGRQCYATECCSFQGKGLWFITMIAGEGWFLQLTAFISFFFFFIFFLKVQAVDNDSN